MVRFKIFLFEVGGSQKNTCRQTKRSSFNEHKYMINENWTQLRIKIHFLGQVHLQVHIVLVNTTLQCGGGKCGAQYGCGPLRQ